MWISPQVPVNSRFRTFLVVGNSVGEKWISPELSTGQNCPLTYPQVIHRVIHSNAGATILYLYCYNRANSHETY